MKFRKDTNVSRDGIKKSDLMTSAISSLLLKLIYTIKNGNN